MESVVKDIVDELEYLQRREMRMRDTNGEFGWRALGMALIFRQNGNEGNVMEWNGLRRGHTEHQTTKKRQDSEEAGNK